MTKGFKPVLQKCKGYFAWTNNETEPLRPANCLCLNCEGGGDGEADGCPHEQAIMDMCAENDLRVAVSRCPVWQASSRSRVAAARETHHGLPVLVSPELEQLRREQCLCLNCDKCRPGESDHCFMAAGLYRLCLRGNLAMVITRCPEWEPKKK
jgi:hypothetical protein